MKKYFKNMQLNYLSLSACFANFFGNQRFILRRKNGIFIPQAAPNFI